MSRKEVGKKNPRQLLNQNQCVGWSEMTFFDQRFQTQNFKLNEKRKNLIEILSNELCPAADRSLRAGARGQRLPAKLLIELGQERKAAKLFLKSRSEAQRYSQKSIRIGNDYSLRYFGATNRVSVGDCLGRPT